MEKRDRLDYNAARYFMVIVFLSFCLFFFLSDKHQWGRAPTQVAAKVVRKDMKDLCRSPHYQHTGGDIDTCMHKESRFVGSVYLLFLHQRERRGDR